MDNTNKEKEDDSKNYLEEWLMFWKYTDFDNMNMRICLILYRLFQALFMTNNLSHPDGIWQSVEVAYDMVYGGVDLPWEWRQQYQIRSAVYPYILAAPLYLLKSLGIDTQYLVLISPYIIQFIFVNIMDQCYWLIGKKLLGVQTTRISMYFYLTNKVFNEIIIRCFSNSMETILNTIAFYYYLNMNNTFSFNYFFFAFSLCLNLFIRNTSPILWIPLIILKIYKNIRIFFNLVLAFILFSLPSLATFILVDSYYYNNNVLNDYKLVITPLNFLRINMFEGISKYFGDDPMLQYFSKVMPVAFSILYPAIIYSFYFYYQEMKNKKQSCALLYSVVFYLFVFSVVVNHKEPRFMLPIFPFTFLIVAYLMFQKIKQYPKLIKWIVILSIVIEVSQTVIQRQLLKKYWYMIDNIQQTDGHIHSLYSLSNFDLAYHSWTHDNTVPYENRTKLYFGIKEPSILRRNDHNLPIQLGQDTDFNICIEMIDKIQRKEIRPQYIQLRVFSCGDRLYCFFICTTMFQRLEMYYLYKQYTLDYQVINGYNIYGKIRDVYKLRPQFEPF